MPSFWAEPAMREALAACDMGAVMRVFRTHSSHGADISQDVAATWVGISQSRLSKIENGAALANLSKLAQWARVLRIPHDLLWFRMPGGKSEPGNTSAPRQQGVEARQTAPEGRGGLLLPVVVHGRPVLLPLDANTVAASRLDTVLDEFGANTGTSGGHVAVTATEWDDMSPLNRRSLLKHGLAASALPAIGLPEMEQVAAAMDDAHRYLDGSVVDYFKRQLAACKADDGMLGTRKTLPMVLGILGAVEEHARDVKPDVRRDLLAVGADSAEFAGWLYRDLRDAPRALYWHDRAIEWAQEAGDMPMQGYVLLKKAQLAYDEREPLRMLTLSQAAQHTSFQLPMRVRAEAVQQEARAEAMLGASVDEVDRRLDRAHQLLVTADERPTGSKLGAHYGPPLFAMQAAICQTEAGQPRRAVALYESSLNEQSFSPRDYGFFLSWMAASLAFAGEPDQAAVTGIASARRATDAHSARTKRELVRVLDILKPWQNRPAIRELREAVRT